VVELGKGGWIPSAIVFGATANSIYEIFRDFQQTLNFNKALLMPPPPPPSHEEESK
jgi:hypothetical protein